MLVQLRIRNFAIIESVDLDIAPGFTVVTGETGAGKSILVGALGLVLGGRAHSYSVRTGAKEAEVEALFDLSEHPQVRARLEQRELVGDDPKMLLVRRVISQKGRAKVVINGRLSTVASLGEIVRGLVEISGQHEQQSLLNPEHHCELLDLYGQLDAQSSQLRASLDALRIIEAQKRSLFEDEDLRCSKIDFIRFQLEEIARVQAQPNEDQELELELGRLQNAEKLRQGAQMAEGLLYGDDGSAFDKVGKAISELEEVVRLDPELEQGLEALREARGEIEEVARDALSYASAIESDEGRLEEVELRLEQLRRLKTRHGGSLEEVLRKEEELVAELDSFEHSQESLETLEDKLQQQATVVREAAWELCVARQEAGEGFAKAVSLELADMDLGDAVFNVSHGDGSSITCAKDLKLADIGNQGVGRVEFMWSANTGEPPRPLAKIASGGELSRLMLAVKSVLRHRDLVSLYVFDEVDTGLGGRAADCIGRKIQKVGLQHQALTITHLPSIAARAHQHFRVSKVQQGERTVSAFEWIEGDKRTDELARMIDGGQVTDATREAARAMLDRRL
jgi:DNA repair protein RecN (Recombination protein N)